MALNFTESEYFYKSKARFNLFGQEILIYMDKNCAKANFEYAAKCVEALNSMPDTMIAELCRYSVAYCEEFCENVDEEAPEIETDMDILQFIHPTILFVEEQKDDDIVISLECNCDWEEEHGIQWLIKGDKILYVGANRGIEISAYAEEKHFQKPWNYAYSNQAK